MRTGKSGFQSVGLARSLLETQGVGLLLFGSIHLLNTDTQNSLFYNTSLFFAILLACWLMIRSRLRYGK